MSKLLIAAAALMLVPACRPDEKRAVPVVSGTTRPIHASNALGSTPDAPAYFVMTSVDSAALAWSAMTAVQASSDGVVVVGARPLTDDNVRHASVMIGREGVDGKTGATSGQVPGAGDPGVTGAPRPAKGFALSKGPSWVVYIVGTLRQGATAGSIFGAELEMRTASGSRVTKVRVMSPVMLCSDQLAEGLAGRSALSEGCQRARAKFFRDIRDRFGVRL
jgi:hypothetical protein